LYKDDCDGQAHNVPGADIVDAAGKPLQLQSFTDALIIAKVLLPYEESTAMAKVMCQLVDTDWEL
jgi:hypothetical protein